MTKDNPLNESKEDEVIITPAVQMAPEKIPDALFDRLKGADRDFHQKRSELEAALDGSDYDHINRVEDVASKLKETEGELEDAASDIGEHLHKQTEPPKPK